MLQGKKRYLGILITIGAKLLQGFGILDEGAAQAIETVGIGVFGVGYVDAEKRKTEALKEVARK